MLSKSKTETPRQAFDKAEAEGDSVSNLNIILAIELKSGGRIKAALDVADAPPAYVIAVDPEFEKADDLLSDLDLAPSLEAESDAEIMRGLESDADDWRRLTDADLIPAVEACSDAEVLAGLDPSDPDPVVPVLTISKPAPGRSAMADISDDEIRRALDADPDLESDLDADLDAAPHAATWAHILAELDDADDVAAPDAGKSSPVNADLPSEPVGDLDSSDEAAIEIAGAVADCYREVEPDPVRSIVTKKLIDRWRADKRRKRGWSELSDRERAAKGDPGELLKARKSRNQADSRTKAGVKSRAEYLAAEAERSKP